MIRRYRFILQNLRAHQKLLRQNQRHVLLMGQRIPELSHKVSLKGQKIQKEGKREKEDGS